MVETIEAEAEAEEGFVGTLGMMVVTESGGDCEVGIAWNS